MRRLLLNLLPKVVISRCTGALTRVPLPRGWRGWAYRRFAQRYGASLDEVQGDLDSFRSLAEFFARPLRDGARPVAPGAPLVWPCDGKIVTCGPIDGDHIEQVKGQTYTLGELLGDAASAERLRGGSQATVYLAPGDYHRVHAPFGGRLRQLRSIRGTLFPVNPPAVAAIPKLFVRNARRVFEFELPGERRGVVVMVGALNVGAIHVSARLDQLVACGEEIGRFGFGSTAIVLLDRDGAGFPTIAPETVVRTASRVPS